MYQTMHSWAQRCCLTPATGPGLRPPWTTPCGSTALSAVMSGCCMSVRAHGQVSMFFTSYLLYFICFVCHSITSRPFPLQELKDPQTSASHDLNLQYLLSSGLQVLPCCCHNVVIFMLWFVLTFKHQYC